MEYRDVVAAALDTLPPLSRKRRRWGVAVINAAPYRQHFGAKPELAARWARVLALRADRLVRHYDPDDPNRLPR